MPGCYRCFFYADMSTRPAQIARPNWSNRQERHWVAPTGSTGWPDFPPRFPCAGTPGCFAREPRNTRSRLQACRLLCRDLQTGGYGPSHESTNVSMASVSRRAALLHFGQATLTYSGTWSSDEPPCTATSTPFGSRTGNCAGARPLQVRQLFVHSTRTSFAYPRLTGPDLTALGVVISVFPSILNSTVIQASGPVPPGSFDTRLLAVNVFPFTS